MNEDAIAAELLVSRELRELRSEKTDRAALAGLFTEAAMRLSGDMKTSGKEWSPAAADRHG